MKFRIISFVLLTALLSSCKGENKVEGVTKDSRYFQNDERPSQAITYPEMASMFKEYDNGQKRILDQYIKSKSRGRDSIATISQFYSITELKQYIAYIEKLSKEKEINLTGIRIFTSAYPSDYKIKEYRNRVSFILAPTTNIGEKKNVAYEPLRSLKGKPVSMQSILEKYADETTKKVSRASLFNFSMQTGSDDSSALNRGTIVPPFHED